MQRERHDEGGPLSPRATPETENKDIINFQVLKGTKNTKSENQSWLGHVPAALEGLGQRWGAGSGSCNPRPLHADGISSAPSPWALRHMNVTVLCIWEPLHMVLHPWPGAKTFLSVSM